MTSAVLTISITLCWRPLTAAYLQLLKVSLPDSQKIRSPAAGDGRLPLSCLPGGDTMLKAPAPLRWNFGGTIPSVQCHVTDNHRATHADCQCCLPLPIPAAVSAQSRWDSIGDDRPSNCAAVAVGRVHHAVLPSSTIRLPWNILAGKCGKINVTVPFTHAPV